jgi:glycosyltransferase involved in cell wall biosynthesis
VISLSGIFRYPVSIIKTIYILLKEKPEILFVQNPSMILAAIACFLKSVLGYRVVVDRHTTFRLNKPHKGSIRTWLFMKLHYYTIRKTDLTIVTNDYLAQLVEKNKGRAFVLPDKLPEIKYSKRLEMKKGFNIMMISSFGKDEPIAEVLEAMRMLENKEVTIYITGNYTKFDQELPQLYKNNVKFTGFIPETEFFNLIKSVDAVIVLTTSDYCMLCGCYEAVAGEKPLITSKKQVLVDYFKNAVHVNNDAKSIAAGIQNVMNDPEKLKADMKGLKIDLQKQWRSQFQTLENILTRLTTSGQDISVR